LTEDEKQVLGKTLKKFPTFFGGGLGMLNIKLVKLELIDGAKPYHARPFPVPHSLEATAKTEMKSLTCIDAFNRSSDSDWSAPTFMQAKKTGNVRILTDFRRLNAQIKRKPSPLPKISDMLRTLSGFKYAMVIDLIMGYYHIPLDLEAQKLCTTILPWRVTTMRYFLLRDSWLYIYYQNLCCQYIYASYLTELFTYFMTSTQ
jgi:hypothetical protein